MEMKRLKVRIRVFDDEDGSFTVMARVLSQSGKTRDIGTLVEKDSFTIDSSCHPELDLDVLHVRGSITDRDDEWAGLPNLSWKEAKTLARRIRKAVRAYNQGLDDNDAAVMDIVVR